MMLEKEQEELMRNNGQKVYTVENDGGNIHAGEPVDYFWTEEDARNDAELYKGELDEICICEYIVNVDEDGVFFDYVRMIEV